MFEIKYGVPRNEEHLFFARRRVVMPAVISRERERTK